MKVWLYSFTGLYGKPPLAVNNSTWHGTHKLHIAYMFDILAKYYYWINVISQARGLEIILIE